MRRFDDLALSTQMLVIYLGPVGTALVISAVATFALDRWPLIDSIAVGGMGALALLVAVLGYRFGD